MELFAIIIITWALVRALRALALQQAILVAMLRNLNAQNSILDSVIPGAKAIEPPPRPPWRKPHSSESVKTKGRGS
jgi:hypothetical protein